ncbi:hypothetical protein [Chitinophaga niabensis]|uniref:Uncharacterized protein n=1 Tax=Chitinophaga niabensis TaxID=536979 RepID=A0A1N6JXH7_9BACT|nr:hypothetical protein [Chitinophaga niabensis]SIO48933.1 hypothetical protein SAMN04488055_4627 [Chitinophaga niabensis]
MVIATNKAQFSNRTDETTGTLRTIAPHPLAANDLFLAFKPAAVHKSSGYLRIMGTGSIAALPLTKVYLRFSKPGVDLFQVKILEVTTTIINPLFSFYVDIPVGTTSHAELHNIYATSQFNGSTSLYLSGAYINAEPDDIWTAFFYYETAAEGNLLPGNLKIASVVAEYKEN